LTLAKLFLAYGLKLTLFMLKYALIFFLSWPAHAEDFNIRDQDKQMHILASYSINTTFLAAMPKKVKYQKLKAGALTAAVGVAKELSDPAFSNADLAADAIGIVASSLCAFTFEF
jgi:hypothetical protein